MLKKSISMYKENILSELKNKNAIGTAGDKNTGFNCLTVSWGGIGVLWGKEVAFVFVRKSRYTYEFLEKSQSFTLSFLDDCYKDQVFYLGTHSGRVEDKVKNAGLSYTYDPDYDGAYIKEASYCFKMKKLYEISLPWEKLPKDIIEKFYKDGDEHTMFICEIKQFLVSEEYDELH
ncbi:MAG: flavin reductase [Anaeroplasmataceae bacterium]|nr:flavin reductase [Anaeroplasmataceae bacterium]